MLRKKILASILFLVLASSFALAEEGTATTNSDDTSATGTNTLNAYQSPSETKTVVQTTEINTRPVSGRADVKVRDPKEALKNIKEITPVIKDPQKKPSSVLPLKELSERERLEERKKLLATISENRIKPASVDDTQLRDLILANTNEFESLRSKVASAKTAEKEKLKVELREKARELVNSQLKANIDKIKELSLDEETKAKIISSLEERMTALKAKDLNATGLAKISKESKRILEENMLRVKQNIATKTLEKYVKFIERAENFSTLLGKKIEELKASGKDTSKVERAKEKLDADIVKLKDVHSKLKATFSKAQDKETAINTMQKAHLALRLAHFEIQKDFILIKFAIKALREISENNEVSEETKEKIEAVVSESENNSELGQVINSLSEEETEEATNIEVVEGGEEQ